MMFHFSYQRTKRRKISRLLPLTSMLLLLFLANVLPARNVQASVNTSVSPGWDIYTAGGSGYRYGPSIIVDAQGIHVYTCSPGNGTYWDAIRYKTSTDGGHTWGTESVVLTPTAGSADNYSTCDPGVVEFGGYYYLAYTSTDNANGTQNNVFVARSTSQTGPFDKWNGSGWGGNPAPFITYSGDPSSYGAGEPSLVVLNSTLYIYYTWLSRDTDGTPINQTRVATASTTDANWPAHTTYQGVAVTKRLDMAQDSEDVKYIDAYSKFIAVNTARRITPNAYVQMWESTDGIHFVPSNMGKDNLLPYLHNDGISGDAQGHIDVMQTNYLAYAYGYQWADWNTYLSPITYGDDTLPAAPQIYTVEPKNGAIRLEFQSNPTATSYTLKYGTQSGTYSSSVSGITSSPYTLTGLTNGTRYYLVMDAVNSSGTSIDSSQVEALPQDYEPVSLTNATASSALSGWPASNAIDGNLTTDFSSQGHTSANSTEWISFDAGTNTTIGRLVVTDRQRDLVAGPLFDANLDTQIQVSTDANTWFPVDYRLDTYPIIDDDGFPKTVIDFPQPIYGRYIRLYSTVLNSDESGNYYLQLGEFQAYSVPETAEASSNFPGWEPTQVLDTDPNTVYSSQLYTNGNATEWIALNLGSVQQIGGLLVTPRPGGLAFPTNFSLQSSTDGTNWSTINGQSYTNYANPGSDEQSFTFSNLVTAQYIRLLATQLGSDGAGNYALQIAGMAVQNSLPFTATASSQASGWPASNVTDGLASTAWSSVGHGSATATEWVLFDMGSTYSVSDIRLVPHGVSCFPQGFTISASTDGTNWTQVPGQVYTFYSLVGTGQNAAQLFAFSSPVTARYLKITATQLTADSYGNYYFQLADAFLDQ